MRIDILTLLPEMVRHAAAHSILLRACEAGIATIRVVDIREHASGKHRITDDTPCGGGGGMILKVEPVAHALDALRQEGTPDRVILMDPRGTPFRQQRARELASLQWVVLICGRYEGVDDRIRQHLVDEEISLGDFILTGGEIPALAVADALIRLQPGALGDKEASQKDSFSENLLEYPQYTRPREFRGWRVPDVLFSGNHALIQQWRRWHQLTLTRERRPDLWARHELTQQDRQLLEHGEPGMQSEPGHGRSGNEPDHRRD